jgi:hypothetical protein
MTADNPEPMWSALMAIGVAFTSLMTVINSYMTRKAANSIDTKIEKVDTKLEKNTEVSNAAATSSASADEKATVAVAVSKATKEELAAKVDHANDMLNGHTQDLIEAARKAAYASGLMDGSKVQEVVTERVQKLEDGQETLQQGHEILKQGQVEIKKAVDKNTEMVNVLTTEIKKQSKY